jgi:hypothetical protein
MRPLGGTPTQKPDVYRRANVLLQVDKVKTPLLVMHGENDPQVPPADSAGSGCNFGNDSDCGASSYPFYLVPLKAVRKAVRLDPRTRLLFTWFH